MEIIIAASENENYVEYSGCPNDCSGYTCSGDYCGSYMTCDKYTDPD